MSPVDGLTWFTGRGWLMVYCRVFVLSGLLLPTLSGNNLVATSFLMLDVAASGWLALALMRALGAFGGGRRLLCFVFRFT